MSSIERRPNASTGTMSYRVRFRWQGKNKSVAFLTEAKALAWQTVLDTMGPPVALALLDDPDPTRGETVTQSIATHIDHLTGITDGTRARYRTIAADHLQPAFGHILTADLTRDDVATWVNTQTCAPKTLRNWHALLSNALTTATRRGAAPANVAKGVKLPRRAHGEEMVFLTRPEAATLLGLIREHYQPLVLTLFATGLRWGEATALTVGALDRATNTARIHQAWKATSTGAMVLGPPKSAKSRRTIAVPDEVFTAVAPLTTGRKATDLVFVTPRGNVIRSGGFYNVAWRPAVAGLEEITGKRPRVHDARHTYASWAIQAGIPLPVIQRQMGHESITTTVDTYGHLARADFDPLLAAGAGLTTRATPPALPPAP